MFALISKAAERVVGLLRMLLMANAEPLRQDGFICLAVALPLNFLSKCN